MTDDERRRLGISDLSKPGEAAALMHRVFPRETAETMHRMTEVPMRSITRWMKDEARFPPTLREKLQRQAIAKRAFLDDFQALLRQHAEAGLLPEVMRQGILVEFHDEFFKGDQSL